MVPIVVIEDTDFVVFLYFQNADFRAVVPIIVVEDTDFVVFLFSER